MSTSFHGRHGGIYIFLRGFCIWFFAAMAEFYSDVDEEEKGIASPVDCWELVLSNPSSPLPEARVDVSALEEAMAVAGESGSLLQDDYFGYGVNASEVEVLPVSTTVVEKQSEDEGHTESANEVVSLEPDKDESFGSEKSKSDTEPAMPSNFLSETNAHNVRHRDGTMYHDDQMYHDGKMHSDAYREGYKMHNEYMMHLDVLLHQDDRMHGDDMMLHDDIIHSVDVKMQNEDEMPSSLKTGMSKMAPLPYHDIRSTMPSSSSPSPIEPLDLPYQSHMSSHDMEESFMSIQQSFLQSGHPAAIPDEGRSQVVTPHDVHGGNSLDSADLQHHDTVGIHNSRRAKGFPCASWLWTQLGRWQTQLGCTNSIWSVALAAAVMGIFVLGRGWKRLQAQNRSLRMQLCVKDKMITQLMFQLIQAKDSLSKTRRIPVIWAKPSLQIPQDNY